MVSRPQKSLADVVAKVGRYREEAYLFVRDGLNSTVEKVHGSCAPEQTRVYQYLQEHNLDLTDLVAAQEAGNLDPQLAAAIEAAGGIGKLNRHVAGQDLCWGLRDLALERWGLLARSVLATWGVTCTRDFGHIVFAMVDNGFMQKQSHDAIEDFDQVFDFREALGSYAFPTAER